MSHHIDALSDTAESLVAMAGGYAKMFEAIERGDVLALVRMTTKGEGMKKQICRCCGKWFTPEKESYTICDDCWNADDSPQVTQEPYGNQTEQKEQE